MMFLSLATMATTSAPHNAGDMVVVTHARAAGVYRYFTPLVAAQCPTIRDIVGPLKCHLNCYYYLLSSASATMATTSAPHNSGGMVVVTHVYPQQGAQGSGLPQTGAAPAPSSRLQKFLKGEPSILGYITAGSLTVGAYKKPGICMVKAALGVNIVSSITSGLAIIFLSLDFILYLGDSPSKLVGVILVLSILQFILSICVSAFGCKATCSDETQPVMYITNQIPASLLTSPPSTDPLNTAEMPLLPPSVLAPAHDGNAESAPTGQFEDLPPKYSLA
ncbi:membrane-spanning 4-domains subfamily A member 18-like isoform X2 [Engraulis encrasicolus]|uniref:membrane-spanning 4-domains subfamily A member 18-like isoform X2 n=1 Tax=Engraulis encrasicolus TaxID=184585 RepID=UPI002FD12412